MDNLKHKKTGSSLLYITDKFSSIGERSLFIIIAIDMKTKKFRIETCSGALYNDLKYKWDKIQDRNMKTVGYLWDKFRFI